MVEDHFHKGSPSKNNGRWIYKHGFPPSKNGMNKIEAISNQSNTMYNDKGNILELPFIVHNIPLHGPNFHNDEGYQPVPPKKKKLAKSILHFKPNPQKLSEFNVHVEEERIHNQK